MKNFKPFLLLSATILFVVIISGFKMPDTTFTDYYYYQGKPYELVLKQNIVYIELKDDASRVAVDNMLSKYPALYLKQSFDMANKQDFVYINENLQNAELKNLVNSLSREAGIANVSPAFGMPEGQGSPKVLIGVEKEIIAQFKSSLSDNEISSFLNEKGMTIVNRLDLSGGKTYVLKVPADKYAVDYANDVYLSGLVNYSEPNFYYTGILQDAPNDPYYPMQWSHKNTGTNIPQGITGTPGCDMRVDSAWTISMGDSSVIVSIVDTGIDTLHPDLIDRMIPGLSYNALTNLPGGMDDNNHGTSCAGIIAATANNGIGVAGVAPNSRIFAIKILNSAGQGTSSAAIAQGLVQSWQRGSWVSSNSWGGGSPITAAENAISDGVTYGRNGKGVVFCFATGNDNGAVSWPATTPNVISVGGVSPCNQRKSPTSCDGENWWGSNYGTGTEIVAPCVKIYTTDRRGSVGYTTTDYVENFNGTSSATPNVSGVVALVLAVDSNLTWSEVRERICSTADKVGNYTYDQPGELGLGGWNNQMGYGKVNAYSLLKLTKDLMKPVIHHTGLVNTENLNGPYIVTANITSSNPLDINGIKLIWRRGEGAFADTLLMTSAGNDNYTASIPGNGAAATYSYYIYAADTEGKFSVLPATAPSGYFSFIAAPDVTPPSITHAPQTDVKSTRWPVTISAQVTDNYSVGSVTGEVRINGGTITTFPFSHTTGDNYTATFPSLPVNVGDLIEYRIKATDNSAAANSSYEPATGYHSFHIILSKGNVLVLDDDISTELRTSNDKGISGDLSSPLGASASLFATVLENASYSVDQVSFGSADTTVFPNYHIIILTAGLKSSSIFNNSAIRRAIINYTRTGGKTIVEGGEVGYNYAKTNTTDFDSLFRREILNDSIWISDRAGSNLTVVSSTNPLFTEPNILPASITVSNSSSSTYGTRDEVTLLSKPGVSRLAYWSTGTAANGGIIAYYPTGDTSKLRNLFFTFCITQITPASDGQNLIINAAEQLIKELETPVELTSLTVKASGNNALIDWQTSTETNNRGFEVERKIDNGFKTIGFISGKGTTTESHSYSFTDKNLAPGKYTYRLKQIDFNGAFSYSAETEVDMTVPAVYSLEQNYPNPFNPSTIIKFSLASDSKVTLKIYNSLGEEVATLVNGTLPAGNKEISYNAKSLSSGVYFYKIEATGSNGANFTSVKKMMLLK